MTAIAGRLEQAVKMAPPPLDPEIVKMAEEAFGYRPA
jgi:hypothetical protein